jgi:hypothetical protein
MISLNCSGDNLGQYIFKLFKGEQYYEKKPYENWNYGNGGINAANGSLSNGWVKIKFAGSTGYVSAQYILKK